MVKTRLANVIIRLLGAEDQNGADLYYGSCLNVLRSKDTTSCNRKYSASERKLRTVRMTFQTFWSVMNHI